MPVYKTLGSTGDNVIVLYEGTDPVLAVHVGLEDRHCLSTWVTEDGVRVPETWAL